MCERMGRVKRAIIETFDAEPHRRFTAAELAAVVYPDLPVTKSRVGGITRVLTGIAVDLGLQRCRAGLLKSGGWRHVWGR